MPPPPGDASVGVAKETGGGGSGGAAEQLSEAAGAAEASTAHGADQTGALDIADAWEEHIDPSSGDTFYFNTLTGETAWYLPGWSEVVDAASGEKYWYNYETNETSMFNPDDPEAPSTGSRYFGDGEGANEADIKVSSVDQPHASSSAVADVAPKAAIHYKLQHTASGHRGAGRDYDDEWALSKRGTSTALRRGDSKYVDIASDEEASPPGQPTGVRAEAGDREANVHWHAPSDDGGAPILSYTVRVAPTGAFIRVPPEQRTARATGLRNGVPTTFTVTAASRAGTGRESEPSEAVVPAGPPRPPSDVSAVPGDASAMVSWRRTAFDNGAEIDAYVITPSLRGALPVTIEATQPDSAGHCSAQVNGLQNGHKVMFRVQAVNRAGMSEPSVASDSVVPAGAPAIPTIEEVKAGDECVHVRWSAPSDLNGASILGYTLHVEPNDGQEPVAVGASRHDAEVRGLKNGVAYVVRVTATSRGGTSELSAASKEVVPCGVPPPPPTVEVEGGDGSVQVMWRPPREDNGAAITGYNVSVSDGHVERVSGVAGRDGFVRCTVDGLVNGSPVTVRVASVNDVGVGDFSRPSPSVTPAGPPGPPTRVVAHPLDCQVELKWEPPSFSGGSPITGYRVLCTAGGAGGRSLSAKRTTAIVSEGVRNGDTFQFAVVSMNAVGESRPSEPCAPVIPAGAPGPPRNLIAKPRDQGCDVSLEPPSFDGGAPVESFVITAVSGGRGAAATVQAGPDGTPLVGHFENLRNGTPVTFSAVAINSAGESEPSPVTAPVVPAGAPGKPRNVVCKPRHGAALVLFMPHKSDGGARLSKFEVTMYPGGATAELAVSDSMTIDERTELSVVVDGLENGQEYRARVVAFNPLGMSVASEPSPSVMPCGPPSCPRNVVAEAGNGKIDVVWEPPSDLGGVRLLCYVVSAHPPQAHVSPVEVAADTCVATLTDCKNGASVAARVVAKNEAGESEAGMSGPVTPLAEPPARVTEVVANAADRAASVSWKAPAFDGGCPITHYIVSAAPSGTTVEVPADRYAEVVDTVVTGLANGEPTTFSVVAVNDAGSSPASQQSVAVRPAGVPGAPTAVSASAGNHQAVVTWHAPENDGGSEVTEYIVTASSSEIPALRVPATTLAATIRGLMNGDPVCFTVAAVNRVGAGRASDPSEMVTPEGPPAQAPGTPSAVAAEPRDSAAYVKWQAPSDTGGAVVTGYIVVAHPDETRCEVNDGPGGTEVLFGGLKNGNPYRFSVRAVNRAGEGKSSSESNLVKPAGPPDPPTAVAVDFSDGCLDVSWTAPVNTNGAAVDEYVVTALPASKVEPSGVSDGAAIASSDGEAALSCSVDGSQSTAMVSGLSNGVDYAVTVAAVSRGGRSAQSSQVRECPSGPAGPPSGVEAVAGNASAVVTWVAPEDDGGALVTGYVVATEGVDSKDVAVGADARSAEITGLENDRAVSFRVAAVNRAGTGRWSPATAPVTPAVSLEDLEAEAERLMLDGEHEDALRAYDAILRKHRSANLFVARGEVLLAMNKARDALSSFDSAIAEDNSFAVAHLRRGQALRASGRTSEGLAAVRRAVRLEPGLYEGHRTLAEVSMESGDADGALTAVEAALALKPDDAQSLFDKGCVLLALGRHMDSVEPLETALKSGQLNDEATAEAAEAFSKALCEAAVEASDSGKHAFAVELLERAVSTQPSETLRIALADACIAAGQLPKALSVFEAVFDEHPTSFRALYGRGRVQLLLGQDDDAVHSLRKARAMNDMDPDVVADLGRALIRTNELDKAERMLNRALDLRSGHGGAKAGLEELARARKSAKGAAASGRHAANGERMLAEGKFAEAVKEFDTAILQGATNATIMVGRAQALAATEQDAAALDAWDTALSAIDRGEKGPEASEFALLAYQGRAHSLNRLGRHAEALDAADKGLLVRTGASSPTSNSNLVGLQCEAGDALLALSRKQEASKRYAAALKLSPTSSRAKAGRAAAVGSGAAGAPPKSAAKGAAEGAAHTDSTSPGATAAVAEPHGAVKAPAGAKSSPSASGTDAPAGNAPPATKAPTTAKVPSGVKAPTTAKASPSGKVVTAVKAPPGAKATAKAPTTAKAPSGVTAPAAAKAPPGVKAPSAAKAPPGVKAPTVAKAPTAAKAPTSVKAPPGVKAPTAAKAPTVVKAPPGVKAPTAARAPTVAKAPPGVKAPTAAKAPPGVKPPPGVRPPPGAKAPPRATAPPGVKSPPGVKAPPSKGGAARPAAPPGVRSPAGAPRATAARPRGSAPRGAAPRPRAAARPRGVTAPPGVRPPAKAGSVAAVRPPAKAGSVAGVRPPAKAGSVAGVRPPAKAGSVAGVRPPPRAAPLSVKPPPRPASARAPVRPPPGVKAKK